MDERERLRRLGDDPFHDDTLDDPTIVDRIPDAGSEFDDPVARSGLGRGTADQSAYGDEPLDTGHDYGSPSDRLPLGTAARPGYGGAFVDPVAGETGTDPGTQPGTMADATYGDRLGGETPMMPPADTQDAPMPPEATGGAVGALGGMVAGAIVGGPPGAVVGGIVGAVGGAIVGGAAAGESDDGPTGDLIRPEDATATGVLVDDELTDTDPLDPDRPTLRRQPTDLEDPVTPVDEPSDPRLR